MNKSKILLLSLSLVPTLTAAEVQIYGTIKSGIEASQTQFGNGRKISTSGVSDLGSKIGMRGSHPIGGANFIWQTEQSAPAANDRIKWRDAESKRDSGESYIGIGSN